MIGDPFPKQRKLSKGASKQRKTEARPLLRRAPRGTPFAVGNNYGIETRFKEGNRANPGGRPKSKKLSDAYRAMAESDVEKPIRIQTRAERVVRKVFQLAERGSIPAAREIADRCEGRPAITITGDGRQDVLQPLLEAVHGMYRLEQARTPQLVAGDDLEDENENE